MELQMTVTLGNILSIAGMIITVIGVLVVLDRRIEKKADRDIMTKELEKVNLLLQKLTDKIDTMDKKLDELKTENDKYKAKLETISSDLLILETEHNARKHTC